MKYNLHDFIVFCLLKDTKPSLPRTCLPPMVPHFTGRQRECDEITGHVTSESTRIVSIWGSPGFGKTSVATAVSHRLHSQGLPVYFISLRGVQSQADLTSKLLSFFRHPETNDRPSQRLSLDDELYQLLSELSDLFVLILDNADELFGSGVPKEKEYFTHFLEEILRRTKKLTFVITTRESFEFLNVQLQSHQAVRIRPLDESSSQTLVDELLPNATPSSCIRITQICGHVPLAMKLLCSSISEDDVQPSQVLDDFMVSLESNNIVEMLDNPDYPSNLRLKLLFDSSFQRLSVQEKEALVSLSVLPESFDLTVAAAVLGISQTLVAKRILQSLRRKSLLDSNSKSGSFVMHQLLLSFASQRGEHEMRETVLDAKSRLCAFYISRFEKLNEQFLTANSMSAFIEFYEDRQRYLESLTEGCLDSKLSDAVFRSLIKAELFLDSLFWCEGENIDKIYDSAIAAAKKNGQNVSYGQLLVSLALTEVTWGSEGRTMQLLSEAKNTLDNEASCSSVLVGDKGKHLCYSCIYLLVTGNTEDGVQCLEEALSLMNDTHEHRILRIIACQILATYYRFKKNSSRTSLFYSKAVQECRRAGDAQLLIIPAKENVGKEIGQEETIRRNPDNLLNPPLALEIICLISEATKHFAEADTKQSVCNAVLNIVREIENPLLQSSLGLFNFQHNVNRIVQNVLTKLEEAANLSSARISYHEKAIEQCKCGKENFPNREENSPTSPALHQEALEKSYSDHAYIQWKMNNYSEALKAEQHALDIRLKMFGQEHSKTADSYYLLGATQHAQGDFASALQHIRRKLFGEEHSSTADSYHLLGITKHAQGDFASAIQSTQRALDIRRKLSGEEHLSTADSYYSLGVIQHAQGNFASAIQSKQRALDIRRKLFGEEHSSTADSYQSLGITQHVQGDLSSAIQSTQRALDIRRKLSGEEHSSTADSYYSLGVTQHAQGNFASAIQSKQRALDIRRKLFGEEHSSTADSYHSLGITQHSQEDFALASQSTQRALDIRRKLFGEEHVSTADSYYSLGVTQHEQGDLSSAIQSKERALDIRRKLFGEEHSSTADSYHSLGVTQHEQGDLTSPVQSTQRVLDIRRKQFGEEHSSTADSYRELGVTQHAQGDFISAIQSKQRALDIRRKLFGEEHSSTADSYHSLGDTQHAQGDFSSAIQSTQRALDIRRKLFGEEHSSTADSYFSLGVTQHEQGDFASAIQSTQRALDIRQNLFGE